MAKSGKNYRKSQELISPTTYYKPLEAMELAKKAAFAKFDESVEIAVKLGIDVKHADQMVRGSVVLPHGTGKKVRVIAFAKADKAKEAESAGADFVGEDDLIAKIEGGWFDFDSVVATPDLMSKVSKLGKLLGPRGLMPNPKVGTVTNDMAGIVKQLKAGMVEFRAEKAGIVHVILGKRSFETDKLLGNLKAVMDSLVKAKPASSKGVYVRTVTISTTMSPGIKLDTAELLASLA